MADEFEGYQEGDVTYCVAPADHCFPVRVVKVGRSYLDIVPYGAGDEEGPPADFGSTKANRRFLRPRLPPSSRFGGWDERLVNSARGSGPELRLLPTHYGTTTVAKIRELHASGPERWPLPTGQVFERWFKGHDR